MVETNDGDDTGFYNNEFDFHEDENFKDKRKNIVIDGDISNELLKECKMKKEMMTMLNVMSQGV